MFSIGLSLFDNADSKNKIIFSLIGIYITYKKTGLIDEYIKSVYNFFVYFNKTKYLNSLLFNTVTQIPHYRNKLDNEVFKVQKGIEESTFKLESSIKNRIDTIPIRGIVPDFIIEKMTENHKGDLTFYNPSKLSGTLYNLPTETETGLLKNVIDIYYKTNPLHSDIFPSLITMEKDIVKMTKSLLNCPPDKGFGTVTTGGTESIILALFGYREYSRKQKGITSPEVVAPSTVHPAFDKGCYYLGIKLRKINVDRNNQLDLEQLSWTINQNTILLVGSLPSFPHGLIDDIDVLNKYASEWNIPIHVDACLGGFVFPFLEDMPPYDFRNIGVQSMSIDTHKYGCCPKGSSVLIFRDLYFFESCYFIQSEWSGGIYATTNLTGSRSGLNLALTWAMMAYNGKEGYRNNAKQIYKGLVRIKTAFGNDSDVFVFGEPRICVVGFGSETIDIYKVSSRMKRKGWNLNELQNPPSFHLCITNCHTDEIITQFIADLKTSLDKVVSDKFNKDYITTNLEYTKFSKEKGGLVDNDTNQNQRQNGDGKDEDKDEDEDLVDNEESGASVYGTTQKVPDQSIVDDVVKCYLNSIH